MLNHWTIVGEHMMVQCKFMTHIKHHWTQNLNCRKYKIKCFKEHEFRQKGEKAPVNHKSCLVKPKV